MGGGCYSYMKDYSRKMSNSSMSREEVFTQSRMNSEMSIVGKIRECRDSEEHPESLPIIIALDVTGSMGMIPHSLITGGFPEIMKKIMDEGILHPQVCFVGIGDQYSDSAPIQVGQFESSDELLDKWLKTIWLEGMGGGNGGESYQLAWWFAANHTITDHFNKRGKKGVLITIGDEPVHKSLASTEFKKLFGNSDVSSMTTSEILKEAQRKWDVYHINLMDYSGMRSMTQKCWKELLGDHVVNTEDGNGKDIPEIISGIILKSVGTGWTKPQVAKEEPVPSKETTHIR